MIARRGLSLEEFWPAFGISRATLFNWLKRDRPPPSKEHQDQLVQFFGMSRDYVLFGRASKLDRSKESPLQEVHDSRAAYGDAETLRRDLLAQVNELLDLAGDNTARLGYLLESFRSVKIPEHWTADIHDQVLRELLEEERRSGDPKAPPTQSSEGMAQGGAGR